ncbi:MAG TPA: hypothetical protein VGL78_00935, partial [Solirubrobacteraceae bacterium]
TVNSSQQIGGSIGTAFLNTIAIAAATSYVSGKAPSPSVTALAAVHGYTVAFWWAAGIFFVGAVLAGVLLRPGWRGAPRRIGAARRSPRSSSCPALHATAGPPTQHERRARTRSDHRGLGPRPAGGLLPTPPSSEAPQPRGLLPHHGDTDRGPQDRPRQGGHRAADTEL